jgi:hypothetical protein
MLGKAAVLMAVSVLLATIGSCDSNGENGKAASTDLTERDAEDLRQQLKEWGQGVSSAQTHADQEAQLEAFRDWLRQEREKRATRDTGPQLGTSIMFYDLRTGKRVDSEVLFSEPDDVEVEVTLDWTGAGGYEKIGSIRFRAKDPSAVERLLMHGFEHE